MRSMFPRNLATNGKPFTNQRTNITFNGILVLNQGKPRIDFENHIDLKSTDWLINSIGERLYVTELVTLSEHYKSCYYINEHEYNQQKPSSPTFSINANTIENSIIGTQVNATINLNKQIEQLKNDVLHSNSSDKEELLKVISLLEDLKNNQKPVPKGVLSKFSSTLARNSWIASPIANFLLSLCLNQL